MRRTPPHREGRGPRDERPRPTHEPSLARALVQDAKHGGNLNLIVEEARKITDPYHAAWTLWHLAELSPFAKAESLAAEAVKRGRTVSQGWRQAELAQDLAKRARSWELPTDLRKRIADLFVEWLADVEATPSREKAVRAAGRLDPLRFLDNALAGENPLEEGKAAVAAAAGEIAPAAIAQHLAATPPALRARLLGHLHVQLRRGKMASTLDAAVAAAKECTGDERRETLRVLAGMAHDFRDLKSMSLAAADLPPIEAARLMATLAGQADKMGDAAMAAAFVQRGHEFAGGAPESERGKAVQSLATASARMKGAAAPTPAPRPPPASRLSPAPTPPLAFEEVLHPAPAPPSASRERPYLALHNGYEGGLAPPHVQALARAAALAHGFDLDLVLIGFPADDAESLAMRCDRESGVAGGRGLCTQLALDRRITFVAKPDNASPGKWPRAAWIGLDENGDPAKRADVASMLRQGRVGLVMGLGPKGLPPQLKEKLAWHLELTGANIPLETATVMGVVAERLRALRHL